MLDQVNKLFLIGNGFDLAHVTHTGNRHRCVFH
jgi:hypothetical protein